MAAGRSPAVAICRRAARSAAAPRGMLRLGPAGHYLADFLLVFFTVRGFLFTTTAVRAVVRI
eukprot:8596344-Lingulodinium_polyedra.AAC.1